MRAAHTALACVHPSVFCFPLSSFSFLKSSDLSVVPESADWMAKQQEVTTSEYRSQSRPFIRTAFAGAALHSRVRCVSHIFCTRNQLVFFAFLRDAIFCAPWQADAPAIATGDGMDSLTPEQKAAAFANMQNAAMVGFTQHAPHSLSNGPDRDWLHVNAFPR